MDEFAYLDYLYQNPHIFGKTFRKIRKEKKFTVEEVCSKNNACNRKTLYNFESGKNCLSILSLVRILPNINTSITDYFAAVFDYQASANEKFMKKVMNYYHQNNTEALKKILADKQADKSKNLEKHAYILMIYAFLYEMDPNFQISQEILEKASDYFFGVEQWGYAELNLFSNTAHVLNINLTITIAGELAKKKEKMCSDSAKRRDFLGMLLNVSYACIKNYCLDNAVYFFDVISELIAKQMLEKTVLERIIFKFMKGYYHLLNGDDDKGKKLMEKAIELFENTETSSAAERYKTYYEAALIQVEKLKELENKE
jgi:Rgg/GadR/MutR family transcriptional activator